MKTPRTDKGRPKSPSTPLSRLTRERRITEAAESERKRQEEQAKLANLKPHPLAEQFPLLEGDDYKSFRDDIEKNGQQVDIVLFEGKILDGRNRYQACQELGIEPEVVEYEGSSKDAAAYVLALNLHRRHLTNEQKRKVIEFKLKEAPERSDRAIAEEVKVSDKTVANVRKKAEASAEIPQIVQRKSKDGAKQKPSTKQPKETYPEAGDLRVPGNTPFALVDRTVIIEVETLEGQEVLDDFHGKRNAKDANAKETARPNWHQDDDLSGVLSSLKDATLFVSWAKNGEVPPPEMMKLVVTDLLFTARKLQQITGLSLATISDITNLNRDLLPGLAAGAIDPKLANRIHALSSRMLRRNS